MPICVNQPRMGNWMMLAPPLAIMSRTHFCGRYRGQLWAGDEGPAGSK